MTTLQVVLADDHPFVLLGVRTALASCADIAVVGEAADAGALIATMQTTACDVLVTDLSMPLADGDAADGLPLIRRLQRDWPRLRIVVLTGLTNIPVLRALMADGGVGLLTKLAPMDELIAAVRSAHAGRAYISGAILQWLGQDDRVTSDHRMEPSLSPSELDVVGMYARGMSVAEIARARGRNVRAIGRQKREAMKKIGVKNDPGLFAYLKGKGVI
jgi:two-component system capsular synthesis response regulator RcsB